MTRFLFCFIMLALPAFSYLRSGKLNRPFYHAISALSSSNFADASTILENSHVGDSPIPMRGVLPSTEIDTDAWLETPKLPFEYKPLSKMQTLRMRFNLWKQFPWNKIDGKVILKVKLGGSLPLEAPMSSLFDRSDDSETISSLQQLTNLCMYAAHDPRIQGIYVELSPLACGYAKLNEVIRVLNFFRSSGKPIIGYAASISGKEYYLSRYFTDFYLPPDGSVDLRGFSASSQFVRNVFAKIGIEPQVQRIGKYKSFGDTYNRSNMSDAQREVTSSILTQAKDNWLAKVSQNLLMANRKGKSSSSPATDAATTAATVATTAGEVSADTVIADTAAATTTALDSNQPTTVQQPESATSSIDKEQINAKKQELISSLYASSGVKTVQDYQKMGLLSGILYQDQVEEMIQRQYRIPKPLNFWQKILNVFLTNKATVDDPADADGQRGQIENFDLEQDVMENPRRSYYQYANRSAADALQSKALKIGEELLKLTKKKSENSTFTRTMYLDLYGHQLIDRQAQLTSPVTLSLLFDAAMAEDAAMTLPSIIKSQLVPTGYANYTEYVKAAYPTATTSKNEANSAAEHPAFVYPESQQAEAMKLAEALDDIVNTMEPIITQDLLTQVTTKKTITRQQHGLYITHLALRAKRAQAGLRAYKEQVELVETLQQQKQMKNAQEMKRTQQKLTKKMDMASFTSSFSGQIPEFYPVGSYLKKMNPNKARKIFPRNVLPVQEVRFGPRIAILNAVGGINTGKSSSSGLNGKSIGSDTIIQQLQEIKRDAKNIQALVLRVDSPGGSALASDLVWRELRSLSKIMPVVASMVDVAASGGYYFAMACDQILAEDLTLTGSIGVVLAKFNAQELIEKIGIGTETLSIGKYAELLSTSRAFTEDEAKQFEELAFKAYQSFVTKAAASRSLPYDALHEVAQGRVWTGREAKERGLVDHLGGLWQAVEVASQLATTKTSSSFSARFGLAKKAQGKEEEKRYRVQTITERKPSFFQSLFLGGATSRTLPSSSSMSSSRDNGLMAIASSEVFTTGMASMESLGGSEILQDVGVDPQLVNVMRVNSMLPTSPEKMQVMQTILKLLTK